MPVWQEYVPSMSRPRATDALAIVGRGKQIRITPAVVEALGSPSHVVLSYDFQGHRVRINRSSADVPYAFPLKRYGGGLISTISSEGFLRWSGIDYSQRREFRVQRLDRSAVVFQVDDAGDMGGEFVQFELKGPALTHSTPNVSISRNGNITLNKAAKDLVDSSDSFVLLYDAENQLIGLRPGRGEPNARRVRASSNQRTWTISAEGFLKHFGVMHSEGRSYLPTLDGGVLVLDLRRAKEPRRRSMKRGQDHAA